MAPKKPTTAPLAHRVPAEPTALILDYCRWLKEQTGYDVDPMSVYLGSALRGAFKKSPGNQKRLAAQAERIAAEKVAREQRRAERAAKVEKPKVEKPKPAPKGKATKAAPAPSRRRPLKGSTVATAEGVVIAQQRHIDLTDGAQ
ncbi:hypothetical protein [Protaetiibacter larvae]|uniref:Uncharacterized protein n=1 Tax=Protaetiibacter larvae TaxID=2592654 RepID=A0A5C1Y7B9_9MICO|nr:hypothetical protein [Protaetiibacter larvae]QEO08802.1 hypothetical protein FLP23_01470 [Protaetiibacter larvae]